VTLSPGTGLFPARAVLSSRNRSVRGRRGGDIDASGTIAGDSGSGILVRAEVRWIDASSVGTLLCRLGDRPLALIALFVSPLADFAAVVAQAERLRPDTDVMACTTAGEIGENGYDEGMIVAVGFPAATFAATPLMIERIGDFDAAPFVDRIALERVALQNRNPDLPHSFAFLIVDGMSLGEDTLTATIAPALKDMPLFGGSAGDGTDFRETLVALNGTVARDAAVLAMVRSRCRAKVFSLDHLLPTDEKMVVTGADPARRIVKSINAEPAAREYARIVGKDRDQLDRFTFAAHPVVVRIGGTHHVRAIREVNGDEELVFFSAIDEGMVLTVASPLDIAGHLEEELAKLGDPVPPLDILSCDCILRRIEAEQTQKTRAVSDVLMRHNIIGFSTYGEQIGPLHVNHTMTGVAFYPPDPVDRG